MGGERLLEQILELPGGLEGRRLAHQLDVALDSTPSCSISRSFSARRARCAWMSATSARPALHLGLLRVHHGDRAGLGAHGGELEVLLGAVELARATATPSRARSAVMYCSVTADSRSKPAARMRACVASRFARADDDWNIELPSKFQFRLRPYVENR
jgi:hypothetical protein